MGERHMPSIFPECDRLKQLYDKCFANFFQHFINSEHTFSEENNPCDPLHKAYRNCVEKSLSDGKLYDIDIKELERTVLNTENDQVKKYQQQRQQN
ncbi:hypothetical protein AB6A40_000054 [Gnathostoma spinigerum]|uniref:Uncharacterized protein n=1 Tax=Gnathostoma spinigerum TaxID=75299 RepID=A0ABD6E2B0_9BILA